MAEAEEMMTEGREKAWDEYSRAFIDTLPGMTNEMKRFLKVVFRMGFHAGSGFVSTYVTGTIVQAILAKTAESGTEDTIPDEIHSVLSKLMAGSISDLVRETSKEDKEVKDFPSTDEDHLSRN